MAIKDRGGKYDVELRGRHVKRVYDPKVAAMLEQSGKRLLSLGKPLPEVIAELRGGASAPQFGPYAKKWLTSLTIEPHSVRIYGANIERAKRLHSMNLLEVDLTALKSLASSLTRKGYAPETVKSTLSTVKAVLNDACDEGLIPSRPAPRVKTIPKPKQVRPGFAISREQHVLLVAHAPIRAHTLFQVWPWLGLRLGEVLALEWADVDLASRRIKLVRQLRIDGKLAPPKNGKRRTIDLIDPAHELLTRWREANTAALVFPGSHDGYMSRKTIDTWCRDTGKDAGIKGFRSHIFRHTYGSWLIEAGAPLTYIASQMGDTIEVLTRTYLHEIEAADSRGMMAFNRWAIGDTEGTPCSKS